MNREVSQGSPILVVAAVASELETCTRLLGEAGVPHTTRTLGVGVVEAGLALGDRALERRFASVWLLGTAGAYDGMGLSIGDVVVAKTHHWASPESPAGRSYAPASLPVRVDSLLPRPLPPDLPRVGCATVAGITVDPEMGRRIAVRTGAAAEHLEAFAVARWAERRSLPFAAVLGNTKRVGPDAHLEWMQNHRWLEDRVGRRVAEHLRSRPA